MTKFDQLLEMVELGLAKNPTVTREAVILWVEKTNRRGIKALKPQSLQADNEIVPQIKMTPDERKRNNLKKTFEI